MAKKRVGMSRREFLAVGAAGAGGAIVGIPKLHAQDELKVLGPGKVPCDLTVNGKKVSLQIEPRVTLLRALRNYADVTGPKEVCDRGACGACTVHLHGVRVNSCMMLALDAQGKSITTVEGLARDGKLHPVQEAFIECDAFQCGYCTSGFIMSSAAFLAEYPKPTLDEIKHGLQGNICRCAAYDHIFQAVDNAAKRRR